MENKEDLEQLTTDLTKDTKELAIEHLHKEIDQERLSKVMAAFFEGLFGAVKKLY